MKNIINEQQCKHLEFIQNIVSRLNSNSFKFKEWDIALTSGLVALYANGNNELFLYVAIALNIVLWIQDAFFLRNERAFRDLYKDIISGKEIPYFSLDISCYPKKKKAYIKALFSISSGLFYGLIILCLFVLTLF